MREQQNSGSSTLPKLGSGRGVPADTPSTGILSDSYRSSLGRQCPQFLIANLELEFRLTGCKTNHMQFSNRKFPAIFRSHSRSLAAIRLTCPEQPRHPRRSLATPLPWPPSGRRLIETPRLKFPVTLTKTPNYKILIETKTPLLNPLLLASVRVSLRPRIPTASATPKNSVPPKRRS